MRFEQLQTELGEGPCLVAYQTGEAVAVADLGKERRFPRFAQRALERAEYELSSTRNGLERQLRSEQAAIANIGVDVGRAEH